MSPIGDAPGVRVFGEEGDEDRANRLVKVAQQAGVFLKRRFLPACEGR